MPTIKMGDFLFFETSFHSGEVFKYIFSTIWMIWKFFFHLIITTVKKMNVSNETNTFDHENHFLSIQPWMIWLREKM